MAQKRNENQNNQQIATIATGTINLEAIEERQAIAKMECAQVIPIKTNIEGWSPEEVNESIEGLFRGLTTVKMPSLQKEGQLEDIEVAVFAVVEDLSNEDGEAVSKQITMRSIAAKRCVTHFKNGLMRDEQGHQSTPVNTMWKIIFKGSKRNKTNTKSSSIFDFYRMNVES